jgi:hypothetical protein
MIKFLRELIVHDFWLKLFSLALAVLIWLTVSFAIQKEGLPAATLILPPQERATFSNLPVVKMSTAQDVRNMKVQPSEIEVTVQGDARTVHGLRANDIRAIVDLTDVDASRALKKRIEVSTPSGISVFRVVPPEVEVIFPPNQ